MEKLKVKGLEKEVSRICLGTWAMGGWLWGHQEDQDSIDSILYALELGINFIDTAPVYGFGRSEEIVGKAIKDAKLRDKVIIATKTGLEWFGAQGEEQVFRNTHPKFMAKELEDSLRRLHLEAIDLYQVHWPDKCVAMEEVALTMKSFLDSGKIKAVGVSNFSLDQMKEFSKICPLSSQQPPYNIFERENCEQTLSYCDENDMITMAYGSLCRGLLTGKMNVDYTFQGDDLRKVDPKFVGERFEQYINTVNALDSFAKERFQKSVLALALRWVLDRGNTVALWGVRKKSQLDAVLDTQGWKLTQKDFDDIDDIINQYLKDPIGPEFMQSPTRDQEGYKGAYPL